MSKGPGMGGLICAVHDDLQIIQELRHGNTMQSGVDLRSGTNGWQRCPLIRTTQPATQQFTGLVKKVTQYRIKGIR